MIDLSDVIKATEENFEQAIRCWDGDYDHNWRTLLSAQIQSSMMAFDIAHGLQGIEQSAGLSRLTYSRHLGLAAYEYRQTICKVVARNFYTAIEVIAGAETVRHFKSHRSTLDREIVPAIDRLKQLRDSWSGHRTADISELLRIYKSIDVASIQACAIRLAEWGHGFDRLCSQVICDHA